MSAWRHVIRNCDPKYKTRYSANSSLDDYSSESSSESYNVPPSYRQPRGNGQLLLRRYCTHSGCLFLCALRTAL